uniref:Uncharacterized protein n=1 Tax=Romanomermis culicivorax TaxID=13658 RepID=A0A915HUY3_ROMCU
MKFQWVGQNGTENCFRNDRMRLGIYQKPSVNTREIWLKLYGLCQMFYPSTARNRIKKASPVWKQ